jgi:hypothetical protein
MTTDIRRCAWLAVTMSAGRSSSSLHRSLLAIPTYAYFYDYSWLDWTLFGILYLISGLGITVGYHRLMSHRSFDCPNWVKGALLIAGAWALQNSAIKWTADLLRHHAQCDQEGDPYNAKWDSGIAIAAGFGTDDVRMPPASHRSCGHLALRTIDLTARADICDRLHGKRAGRRHRCFLLAAWDEPSPS